MPKVTKKETRQALAKLVRENPDRYNNECYLFKTDEKHSFKPDLTKPECVVGHVIHKLGLTDDPRWAELNFAAWSEAQYEPGEFAVAEDHFTKGAVNLLIEVQAVADRGASWANALKFAEEKRSYE